MGFQPVLRGVGKGAECSRRPNLRTHEHSHRLHGMFLGFELDLAPQRFQLADPSLAGALLRAAVASNAHPLYNPGRRKARCSMGGQREFPRNFLWSGT